MAKQYMNKKGEKKTWFSPKDKVVKYCNEKKYDRSDYSGAPLTDAQKAYRDGYIKAHQDHTTLHLLKNGQGEKVRAWEAKKREQRKKYLEEKNGKK
ncbi:MAG: hypothetical protein IJX39_00260 [Clostridia bacterium]|nr:hypothetical protein [Clostridia bacterium]